MAKASEPKLLGPFIGYVTATSAKIWLYLADLGAMQLKTVFVTAHVGAPDSARVGVYPIQLTGEQLNTGICVLEDLRPDTVYFYQLWSNQDCTEALDLDGLAPEDLHFQTLPSNGFEAQLDFLLMSCHDPAVAADDGHEGFAVWDRMPEIAAQNKNVRFVLMIGDQVYADSPTDIAKQVRAEKNDVRKRQELYVSVYRRFWSHISYRRVLCRLPSILIWDDHDITDGWGSELSSFVDATSSDFKPEWRAMFEAARTVSRVMQASRNPPAVNPGTFDTCFRIGKAGFAVVDLRSNRNLRLRRMWMPEQLEAIKTWVDAHHSELEVLFFVTPVVFSHGAPDWENVVLKTWNIVLKIFIWLKRSRFRWIRNLATWFWRDFGDLRDDINDSWASEVNADEADRALDFLFGIQNPPAGETPLLVVILSGDIHTPGYSTLYSADEAHHERPTIPHIVASPVAYQPFSWELEAVYRHATKAVQIGN